MKRILPGRWTCGLVAALALLAGCGSGEGPGGGTATAGPGRETSSTPGPARLSAGEGPVDAQAAAAAIGALLGLPASSVRVIHLEPRTWPDGCLGLAEPGQVCTQALIDGWLAIARLPDGAEVRFRGGAGRVIAERP